ncbi:DUF6415 family natural product biosynthesis protein [Streptomyces boninensis]|uniref:DUF6415 family natural product biosynthesis protein n=1 Tax=Streptomyces boninensis TaxID=2039455 RepID=UPI003B21364C
MSTVSAHADSDSQPCSASGAEVDAVCISETIRQTAVPRPELPARERIDVLIQRLRGHAGLLLGEPLGEDDYELRAMRREATVLLKLQTGDMSRDQAWEYAQCLGASTKGLLRRHQAAGKSRPRNVSPPNGRQEEL